MSNTLSIGQELTLDHPSIKPFTVELVMVTPDLAEEWLGLNRLNRNQRKQAIARYARDIERGDWLLTGESIKFDWNGDLIDGQHRLEAVIAAQQGITLVVMRGLDPRVRDVLDVNIKRSGADALKFNGVDTYTTLIAAVARASTSWKKGIYKTSTSIDQSGSLAISNSEVVHWYERNPDINESVLLGKRVAKRLNATPTAAVFAVFMTYKVDPDAAIEFWTSIVDLRTDGVGDPRLAMADAFARVDSQHLTKVIPMQLSLLFRAWNAWRTGKSVKRFEIFGTRDNMNRVTGISIPEPK